MSENRCCNLPCSRQMTSHVPDTFIYFPAHEEKHPQQQHFTVTRLLPRHKTLLKACGLLSLGMKHLQFSFFWSLVKEAFVS